MSDSVPIDTLPLSLQALFGESGLDPALLHNWAFGLVRTNAKELDSGLSTLETNGFLDNPELKARAAFWRGWLAHDRSDFRTASACHMAAWEFFEHSTNTLDKARCAQALAASYKYLGFFDQALEWAEKGLQIAATQENSSMLAALMVNIGDVLIQLKHYREAEDYLQRARDSNPSEASSLVITLKLSELYLATDRQSEALDLSTKGLRQAERMGQPGFHAQAIASQAVAMAANGKIREAKGLFVKALRITEKLEDKINTAESLLSFGQVCLEHGDAGSAKAFFERALALGQDLNTRFVEAKASLALAGLYKMNGEWEQACRHLEQYSGIREEIFEHRPEIALKSLASTKAVHDAHIYKNLYDRISAIAEAGREITSVLDIKQVEDRVYAVIKKIMPADTFGLALHRPGSDALEYSFMLKEGGRIDIGNTNINDKSSFAGWCFRNQKDILVNDIDKEYHKYVAKPVWHGKPDKHTKSLLYCPLLLSDKVTGIISVQAYRKNAYTKHDLEGLKAVALFVAIALENARLYQEVERIADHDSVTGALNRPAILKAGELEYERHHRYGNTFSAILLEINNLKFINSTLGHTAGDAVLQHTVEQLAKRFRTVDSIGRFSGEAFLILLPETGRAGVQESAKGIHQALSSQHCHIRDDCRIELEYCLATITFDKAGLDFDSGIKRLIQALGDQALESEQSIVAIPNSKGIIVDANPRD